MTGGGGAERVGRREEDRVAGGGRVATGRGYSSADREERWKTGGVSRGCRRTVGGERGMGAPSGRGRGRVAGRAPLWADQRGRSAPRRGLWHGRGTAAARGRSGRRRRAALPKWPLCRRINYGHDDQPRRSARVDLCQLRRLWGPRPDHRSRSQSRRSGRGQDGAAAVAVATAAAALPGARRGFCLRWPPMATRAPAVRPSCLTRWPTRVALAPAPPLRWRNAPRLLTDTSAPSWWWPPPAPPPSLCIPSPLLSS